MYTDLSRQNLRVLSKGHTSSRMNQERHSPCLYRSRRVAGKSSLLTAMSSCATSRSQVLSTCGVVQLHCKELPASMHRLNLLSCNYNSRLYPLRQVKRPMDLEPNKTCGRDLKLPGESLVHSLWPRLPITRRKMGSITGMSRSQPSNLTHSTSVTLLN